MEHDHGSGDYDILLTGLTLLGDGGGGRLGLRRRAGRG